MDIETVADGSGTSVDSITFTNELTIPLHAVVRDARGKFVRTEAVTWETPQTTGYFSTSSGSSTSFVPTCESGEETIVARSKAFGAKALRINVAYTATSVSGIKTWFRADSLRQSNGSGVSQWTDCSGNRVTITDQGNTNWTPIYSSEGIGGKPAIHYNTINDGAGDRHVAPSASTFDTTDEFTHIVVNKLSMTPWNFDGIHLKLDAFQGWFFQFRFTTGYQYRVDTTAMANQVFGFLGGVDTNAHIISGTYSPGLGKIYMDGVLQSTNAAILHGAGLTSTTTLNVSGPCRPGEPCYVSEFLFFDKALSDTDRALIERYLGRKYGISVP